MIDRYQTTARYLKQIEDALDEGWRRTHDLYLAKNDDSFLGLALIHPDHLKTLDGDQQQIRTQIQGSRSFKEGLKTGKCQSELLWGYECPLKNAELQTDHLFPFSLGGPTTGNNSMTLCKYHNMVKSNDIHCYPWEESQIRYEVWLPHIIEKFKRYFF